MSNLTNNQNKYIVKYIPQYIIIETRVFYKTKLVKKEHIETPVISNLAQVVSIIGIPIKYDPVNIQHMLQENHPKLNLKVQNEKFVAYKNEPKSIENVFPNPPNIIAHLLNDNENTIVNENKSDPIPQMQKNNPEIQLNIKLKKIKTNGKKSQPGTSEICDVCGKVFSNRTTLLGHINRHFSEKWQTCQICGKKMPDGMIRHMRIHTGEKPFACKICGIKYRQIYSLRVHEAKKHTGVSMFSCKYCKKRFSDQKSLSQHKAMHINESIGNSAVKKKLIHIHECNVCGKTNALLVNHKKHIRTHSDDKPYKCDICQATYKYQHTLSEHKRGHREGKKFQCDRCPMKFFTKVSLRLHLDAHIGDKKYACPECDKKFVAKANMKKHMVVHTGEKKHRCKICLNTYRYSSSLYVHSKSHKSQASKK